ncbi:TPA: hypothetical protein HA251_03400 [Candidatus Woesearchaeota archaeon]|nr:hypothetical protein [Candidatus Woesearchaeota archaeon]
MTIMPEGWFTRLDDGPHRFVNMVPQQGKEPLLTYFDRKELYAPEEQQRYEERSLRRGDDILWLGITGWTKPPKHYPACYGTSDNPKIYGTLVTALLMESVLALKTQGIQVDIRHGASDAGVDAAVLRVMEAIPVSGSGVNCPMYMPWVTDDTRGGPVLVAKNKDSYHDLYSQYHQILLVTGGRDVAFHHDYLRRLKGVGCSVVADVMQTVSTTPIPAYDCAPGQDTPQLNNAAAYVREKNSFTYTPVPRSFDELSAITQLTLVDQACRLLKRAPDVAFMESLDDSVVAMRKRGRSQPAVPVSIEELEIRIGDAQQRYLSLS